MKETPTIMRPIRCLIGLLLPCVGLTAVLPAADVPHGGFQFVDVTAEVGLDQLLHGCFTHALAWGDFDGDGRLDVFLGTFSDRNAQVYGLKRAPFNMLLKQAPGGKFAYHSWPPLEYPARCSGAVFVDLDNDGDLDLYVSSNRWAKPSPEQWRQPDRGQGCKLFRNDGQGKFVEVSEASGACPSTLYYCRDIGVFDFDNDGRLDLLVLQDTVVHRDGKAFGSRLFRNKGHLQFEDVTVQMGLPADLAGYGIAVADLNGDRRPDFFVAGSNRFFLSQPNGTYKEAESLRAVFDHHGKELDSVTGAVFGDLNGDGLMDLVTGTHSYLGPSRVHVYLNGGLKDGVPQFREITRELGIPAMPNKAPHPEIQDFDNDGIPDLYWSAWFAEGDRRWPFICRGLGVKDGLPRYQVPAVPPYREELLKKNVPPATGVGMVYFVNGPAVDFDGDGKLDFLCGNWPPGGSRCFRNATRGGNWLQVRVEGTKMNRMGIGAQVRLYRPGQAGKAAALLGYQEITVNGGYSSSRPPLVHFGLGKVVACDVQITFPSRAEPLVVREVRANQCWTVREP